LRAVLAIGLDELGVLLLDLLGVLAGRAEQQWLEVVVQVLPCLRGDLSVSDPRCQVADGSAAIAAVAAARLGLRVDLPRAAALGCAVGALSTGAPGQGGVSGCRPGQREWYVSPTS
jgi:hypothetical protein